MEPKVYEFPGLTAKEAERLAAEGKANAMPRLKEGGVAEIIKRNVLTLFNLLNVVLAALLLWVGSYRDMLFVGVVVSNILIGAIQELRAKRTHDRLKLLSESKVRAMRDGVEVELAPGALVLGDVVNLARGEQIPADAVVLCGGASADESLLTGESVPVPKREGDTLFSGSFLTEGVVTARLVAVGADSYAGKLQMSARKVKRGDSALMKDMNRLIRYISIAIVPIGCLMYWKLRSGLDLIQPEAVTKTVASVLGMIPEGLILLTSIALAVGVVKLGKRKALVNELYGIESLARTDVVCMDKTGTLTSGEMTLEETEPLDGTEPDEIARCLGALLASADEATPTTAALSAAYPKWEGMEAARVVPFSSERKWSAASFEGFGAVVLGAPEKTLNGQPAELAREKAALGLRVLALLRSDAALEGETLPAGLRPIALLCLRDSLRTKVCETVRYFGEQGVSLKVISGDSPLTVSSVAQDAGVPDADRMIDLSSLSSPVDYRALSREYTVFGRVSPEDKRELISAMKADGHGVAMVGDGVNDIPALKAADCSIAMAGGSDAASRVAQITLLNADFEIMPEIVLEGRRVINNITRASSLFLVKNIYSFVLSLLLLALPFAYPFAPIQLTLVSALTIGFPSFVLALQPSRERVHGGFLKNVISRALPGGLCVALLSIAVLALQDVLGFTEESVNTLCTLLAGYSGLTVLLLTCLPLNLLRGVLVLLMAGAFVLAVTFLPAVFYLEPLSGSQWWVLLGFLVLAPLMQVGLGALIRGISPRSERRREEF